jgi:hypothetical protein
LSIKNSLAELVIDNRKDRFTKTHKPVNVESETYKQIASQCELKHHNLQTLLNHCPHWKVY